MAFARATRDLDGSLTSDPLPYALDRPASDRARACIRRHSESAAASPCTHAAPFYERAGYAREGAVYDEVGIPHIAMRKRL